MSTCPGPGQRAPSGWCWAAGGPALVIVSDALASMASSAFESLRRSAFLRAGTQAHSDRETCTQPAQVFRDKVPATSCRIITRCDPWFFPILPISPMLGFLWRGEPSAAVRQARRVTARRRTGTFLVVVMGSFRITGILVPCQWSWPTGAGPAQSVSHARQEGITRGVFRDGGFNGA